MQTALRPALALGLVFAILLGLGLQLGCSREAALDPAAPDGISDGNGDGDGVPGPPPVPYTGDAGFAPSGASVPGGQDSGVPRAASPDSGYTPVPDIPEPPSASPR